MAYHPDIHHRRSVRLKGYDYSQAGAYFITICAKNWECAFGQIKDDRVVLYPIGEKAHEYWMDIPEHYGNVVSDEFVVMPNHVHGIIVINDVMGDQNVGVQNIVQNFEPLRSAYRKPAQNTYQHIIPKSIGSIIRAYKSAVTHWSRQNGCEDFLWQRNYYEHIIRNEKELHRIRTYIVENPMKWALDDENPVNLRRGSIACRGSMSA